MKERLKDELRTSMYTDLLPLVRTDDIQESDMANAIGLPNRPTAMAVVPLSRVLVGTFQDMRQACEDLVYAWREATANTQWEDSRPVCVVRGAYGDRRKAVLGLVCAGESDLLVPGEWGGLLNIDRLPDDPDDMVDALAASVARFGLTSRIEEASAWRLGCGIGSPLPAGMWSVDVTQYPELDTVRLGLITYSSWLLLARRNGDIVYLPWRDEVEARVRWAVSVVQRINGGGEAGVCLFRGSCSRVYVTLDKSFAPVTLDDLPYELSQAKDDPFVVRWVQDRLKAGEPVDADPAKPATISVPLDRLLRAADDRSMSVREVLDALHNRVMADRRLSDGFSCSIEHASLVLTEDSGRSLETGMADALITLLAAEDDLDVVSTWMCSQGLASLTASAWHGRLFHHADHGWWLHLETDRAAMLAQTMAPKGIADELCAAGQVCMSVAGAPDYKITPTEDDRVATVTPERCRDVSQSVNSRVGADSLVLEWLSDYDPAHVGILAEYLEHEAMLAREAADQPED